MYDSAEFKNHYQELPEDVRVENALKTFIGLLLEEGEDAARGYIPDWVEEIYDSLPSEIKESYIKNATTPAFEAQRVSDPVDP
jgi:hypothetical protein